MITVNEKEHILEQKYRPSTIDECILPAFDKETFKSITSKGKIPHIILHSPSLLKRRSLNAAARYRASAKTFPAAFVICFPIYLSSSVRYNIIKEYFPYKEP